MPPLRRSVLLIAFLSSAFVLTRLHATALAVLSPRITLEMGLAPDALGGLASVFMFAFAGMQVVVGPLLDGLGPRRTISGLLVFSMVGSFLFANGDEWYQLTLGYALIGIGSSSTLLGSLLIISRRFPPDRMSTLIAVVMTVGGLGGIVSATPLAALADDLGWRNAYLVMGAVSGTVSLILWFAIPESRKTITPLEPRIRPIAAALAGYRAVARTPNLGPIMALSFVSYATMASVRGLWIGPYLYDVHDLDSIALGNAIMMVAAAMIVGTMIFGPLDRLFNTRKIVTLSGAALTTTVLLLLALWPDPTTDVAIGLLVLLGCVGVYDVVLLAHARAIFPDELAGRGVAAVNVATFAGAGFFQVLTGFVVDAAQDFWPSGADMAYRAVFATLALAGVLALVLYARSVDIRPFENRRSVADT